MVDVSPAGTSRHRCTQSRPAAARRHPPRDQCSVADQAVAQRTIPRDAAGRFAVDEDVWLLHVRWHRTRSAQARDELFEIYRPLAESTAHRFYRGGADLADLCQVADEGLLVALNRFDPARSIPFAGFAVPTIVGCIKRFYRDQGWALHVPRRVHELAGPISAATERLARDLARMSTPAELADELGLDLDELLEIQEAVVARRVRSLDVPRRGASSSGAEPCDSAADAYARVDECLTLADALQVLDPREREVLRAYYLDEKTQTEIAAMFGVSQMQISRWIRQAVHRLRREAAA